MFSCVPCNRSSVPQQIFHGELDENPDDADRRHIYKAGKLVSLEIADVMAPAIFMAFVSMIYVVDLNNRYFGLGPDLDPLKDSDLRSGWKWNGALMGAESLTALIALVVMNRYTALNPVRILKVAVADNIVFLARMTLSQYTYIFSILLCHMGVVSYI